MIEVISIQSLKTPVSGITDSFVVGVKFKPGIYVVTGLDEYLRRGSFPENAPTVKADSLLDFSKPKQKERAG